MAAGNTFAFAFRVQGTVNGAPYANRNAMFFEVEDDKIRRWREYIDDLDLESIKAIQAGAGRSAARAALPAQSQTGDRIIWRTPGYGRGCPVPHLAQ